MEKVGVEVGVHRYYVINCHEGKTFVALVNTAPEYLAEGWACNEIGGLAIVGSDICIRDPRDHVFLTIECQDTDDAKEYALKHFGHTCLFG